MRAVVPPISVTDGEAGDTVIINFSITKECKWQRGGGIEPPAKNKYQLINSIT